MLESIGFYNLPIFLVVCCYRYTQVFMHPRVPTLFSSSMVGASNHIRKLCFSFSGDDWLSMDKPWFCRFTRTLYFEWSPPWHYIWKKYSIIFWHSIWHSIWHLLWHFLWHSIWHFFCHMFWHTFWHAIWHSVWHSFLAFYLASILTFLSGILSGISSEILCGWGPAGNTLIRSSRWRSGGEHFDPELAVEVLAVVWRGTLWSGACGGGPAGITLIQRLLFGSGGEHCDLELEVEVRRRKEEEGGGGGRRRTGWHKI